MRCSVTKSKGLSIVETIVVIALFSILMGAIIGMVSMFYRLNSYTVEQSYEVAHARRGVELLIRDMREMTYGDNGAYPLATMSSSSISFYSDIDRDDSVEYVRYTLATTTLYKYVYNATGTPVVYPSTPSETYIISEYVRNNAQATSTFRYYIEGGASASATSTAVDVRYITVNLIINIDPFKNPGEYMLRSSAAPRNLKETF